MNRATLMCAAVAGALFGFGLSYATMIKPEVVLSFLRFEDFGLLWVLGSAASVTLLAYQLVPRLMAKPLFATAFGKHPSDMNRDTRSLVRDGASAAFAPALPLPALAPVTGPYSSRWWRCLPVRSCKDSLADARSNLPGQR